MTAQYKSHKLIQGAIDVDKPIDDDSRNPVVMLNRSQFVFQDGSAQAHLSVMQMRISSREQVTQQDVTFVTGYIIGIFTLCHFMDVSAVVNLTVRDYLMISYISSNERYIIENDNVGIIPTWSFISQQCDQHIKEF